MNPNQQNQFTPQNNPESQAEVPPLTPNTNPSVAPQSVTEGAPVPPQQVNSTPNEAGPQQAQQPVYSSAPVPPAPPAAGPYPTPQQAGYPGYQPQTVNSSSGSGKKKIVIILAAVFSGVAIFSVAGLVLLGFLSGGLSTEARFKNTVNQTETVEGITISVDVPKKYEKNSKNNEPGTVTWGVVADESGEKYVAQEFILASTSEPISKADVTAIKDAYAQNDAATKGAFEGAIKEGYKQEVEKQNICSDVEVQNPAISSLSGADLAFTFTFTCKASTDIASLGTNFAGKVSVGYIGDKGIIGMGVIVPKTIYDKDTGAIDKAFASFTVKQ